MRVCAAERDHAMWLCGIGAPRHNEPAALQLSTIRYTGICGRVWNDFCGGAGLVKDVQATVQQGHEPDDGRYHGYFSDGLDLLRLADFVTAGDSLELHRRDNKFHDRVGIFSICSQRNE